MPEETNPNLELLRNIQVGTLFQYMIREATDFDQKDDARKIRSILEVFFFEQYWAKRPASFIRRVASNDATLLMQMLHLNSYGIDDVFTFEYLHANKPHTYFVYVASRDILLKAEVGYSQGRPALTLYGMNEVGEVIDQTKHAKEGSCVLDILELLLPLDTKGLYPLASVN